MDRREREEFARIERELTGSDPQFGSSVSQMSRSSLLPSRALRMLLLSAALFGLTPLGVEAGVLLLAAVPLLASLLTAVRWLVLMRVFLASRPPLQLPDGSLVPAPWGPYLFASAALFVLVASATMMLVVLLLS